MPYRFLSPEWFAEVGRIRAEIGDLGLPEQVRRVVINLEVTDAPEGTIEAHVSGGAVERGFAPGAPTKLRLAYEIAHKVLVAGNRTAGVTAFMRGQIHIEGDIGSLMALQGGETPESRKLVERISAITT